jgi:exodeoxyribonuclease VIII
MADAKTDVRLFHMPGLRGGDFAVRAHADSRLLKVADVVVDLETLGRGPGCQVLEVGAACLLPDGGVQQFQAHPSLFDQKRLGLTVDPATLLWWMGPDLVQARAEVLVGHRGEGSEARPLDSVLTAFEGFLRTVGPATNREVKLWGNGASFDLGILGALYDAAGRPRPWKFWAERDLRTLLEFGGKQVFERVPGTEHIGRYDACHELAQLQVALHRMEERR